MYFNEPSNLRPRIYKGSWYDTVAIRSRTRVEAAQRQMERTNRGLKQIAAACGFGSVDLLRRAFVRLLGIPPGRYRSQFLT